jgi:hypothetical protein
MGQKTNLSHLPASFKASIASEFPHALHAHFSKEHIKNGSVREIFHRGRV